jgi:hypothetical protein
LFLDVEEMLMQSCDPLSSYGFILPICKLGEPKGAGMVKDIMTKHTRIVCERTLLAVGCALWSAK